MVGVAVALLVVMAVMTAEGQDIPSCASGLVPCADYLNATSKPPASCCDPIKEAVTKQLPCLCNLYNTPGLLKSFGINVTQAVRLPTLCGVPGDLCQGNSSLSPSLYLSLPPLSISLSPSVSLSPSLSLPLPPLSQLGILIKSLLSLSLPLSLSFSLSLPPLSPN
uniref:Bifunctional inhibitor/plant lipid transfer protein/seed storage helical domain-containing protein n=1 Tax=Daucus carota subsp. sativus TaxID=79200 RepID=A0A166CM06_DAUCS